MLLTSRHAIALSAALLVPMFSQASTLDIEYYVSKNGGEERAFLPYETAQTIEEFYNYDDDPENPGGRPQFDLRDGLERDAGLVFLHRDTRTGTLGLGMILDNMSNDFGFSVIAGTSSGVLGDQDGGFLQFMLSGAPESARIRFADGERGDYVPVADPDEFVEKGGSPDDLICVESDVCAARATQVAYDGPSEGVREPEVNGLYSFTWQPEDTDGFVADGLEGSEWSLLFDGFRGSEDTAQDDPFGIFDFLLVTPDLEGGREFGGRDDLFGPNIRFDADPSLRITAAQAPAPVPLPGGLPLMAGAMLGLAALSRRARRRG